jgi:rRNA processing protein Krr1/Pno1
MASEISVNGSSVAVEGHLHSVSDISGLSSILSGITESSIWKNQVSASAATFDQVTADVGNFRLISVSGSANFAVNNVSASAISVNGTPVSLEGHIHTMSQITGLVSSINAFAAYESRIA